MLGVLAISRVLAPHQWFRALGFRVMSMFFSISKAVLSGYLGTSRVGAVRSLTVAYMMCLCSGSTSFNASR